MTSRQSRPFTLNLLLILMLFQGLSGLAGGIGLILDPTGASMRIPLNWLNQSPFENYLIPGIILLTVLGIFPLAVFAAMLKPRRQAWFAALMISLALIIWIAVEIAIIGYQAQPPLQVIYGLVGLLMVVMVFTPSVKTYYNISH